MAVNLNDPRRADARGWGPMWPHDRSRDMRDVVVDDVHFPGGIHKDLADLFELLVAESVDKGYIDLRAGWCWGYANRPIKNPDGTFTDIPSNHSAGTAGDLNAPENPFGGTSHTIPQAMADLWNEYGFRWGGDYSGTKDWMHFEFMGTPQDAKHLLEQARRELDDVALTDDQKDALQFAIGQMRFLSGDPEPKESGPRRRGWRFARAVSEPADRPDDHG